MRKHQVSHTQGSLVLKISLGHMWGLLRGYCCFRAPGSLLAVSGFLHTKHAFKIFQLLT